MSKIGKKPIPIPNGVEVKIDGSSVSVKGPKGELGRELPAGLNIKIEDSRILISPKNLNGQNNALWGLASALTKNMLKGVSDGFEKVLEFQGVGYKAVVKGTNGLELGLGYSHPIVYTAPDGITFKVEKSSIIVQGIDKELVGKVAAEIRSFRKPEPYKGRGIRYKDEVIIRKAGKKAVASG